MSNVALTWRLGTNKKICNALTKRANGKGTIKTDLVKIDAYTFYLIDSISKTGIF